MELVFLTGLIIGWGSLTTYAQLRIMKTYALAISERIQELNDALGDAIESIMSGEMGGIEPPNPIMGIVAQILSARNLAAASFNRCHNKASAPDPLASNPVFRFS